MNKVLMIGLDGATFSLLNPLMDEGVMPFLKQFLAQGVHGNLMSTQNPLTPPAWISMITGRSPDVHGVYDFTRPEFTNGSVYVKVTDSRDIRCETVWSMASRQGKRVTALNFYGMAPAFPVEGYLMSGFITWKHLRRATYPPSFFDTLKDLPSFDYKHLSQNLTEERKYVQSVGKEDYYEDWIDWQSKRTDAWATVLCYLMKNDPTDLTAIVLDGPDKLQHFCWRYLDPQLIENYSSPEEVRLRQLCLDYYRELDKTIEHIVSLADPSTNVVFTSDHGFGATTEVVYINEWLSQNGYLTWGQEIKDDPTIKLSGDGRQPRAIDWNNTLAFCHAPSSNAIYVNQSHEVVQKWETADYVKFCTKIRQQLLDFRNPDDGGQVFTSVELNKARIEGMSCLEHSPDIVLQIRDGGFVSVLKSPKVVFPREKPDGTHRPDGIFIARGPDIKVGQKIEPLSILDITSLMLYLLDLPIPTDLEGRVPTEILIADSLNGHSVEYQSVTQASFAESEKRDEISEEEKEALMDQLKLLGYMD